MNVAPAICFRVQNAGGNCSDLDRNLSLLNSSSIPAHVSMMDSVDSMIGIVAVSDDKKKFYVSRRQTWRLLKVQHMPISLFRLLGI